VAILLPPLLRLPVFGDLSATGAARLFVTKVINGPTTFT
jgi:hypothetical protein